MRALSYVIAGCLLLPLSATAQVADSRQQMRESEKNQITKLPVAGKYKRSEIMRCSMRDGLLAIEWTGKITTPTPVRIEIEGSKNIWVVHQSIPLGDAILQSGCTVLLASYDFDRAPESGPYCTTLNLNSTAIGISAAYGPGSDRCNVSYAQMDYHVVRFHWADLTDGQLVQSKIFTAPSLLEMRNGHAAEVRKRLEPVLKELTGINCTRADATDIYRAFDKLQPDADIAARFKEILPRLDAASFIDREAASKDLASLGTQGVLAALRVDQQALTPEQQHLLNTFLEVNSRRNFASPAAARQDLDFVLDALEDSDAQVRSAAKQAIEELIHRKLEMDVAASGEKLTTSINALRAELEKQKPAPATRPAASPIN